jgi:hypothetical protein
MIAAYLAIKLQLLFSPPAMGDEISLAIFLFATQVILYFNFINNKSDCCKCVIENRGWVERVTQGRGGKVPQPLITLRLSMVKLS